LNYLLAKEGFPELDAPEDYRRLDIQFVSQSISGCARHAQSLRFPGPEQHAGVYADRTVKITVYNGPPGGGTSNSVSLGVFAKGRGGKETRELTTLVLRKDV